MKIRVSILILAGLMLCVGGFVLAADPTPPTTFSAGPGSTYDPNNYGLQTHEAIAGNITSLLIAAVGQTKAWQGYYGNITATITLDDALNYTFYNWSSAEPRGQVYATLNSSIGWSVVECYNWSGAGLDYFDIESYYGISFDDVDGVNETYTATNHPDFQVGSRTLSGCPTAYVYQNDEAQTANFVNVLLHDFSNNDTGWIYTTLIENKSNATGSPQDMVCYNNAECDFQILVNEDGHGTDTISTTYYFWVELI